jgi:recombination protein RecA
MKNPSVLEGRAPGNPHRVWGEGIPTGSLALDLALGTGGWPRGRIVEVYGSSGSGKTTLLLSAIAQVQKAGGMGAFIDADHGVDRATAGRLGIDVETMPFLQTSSLEEAFESIEELVKGGAAEVIALDTVAALLPESNRGCSRDAVPPVKNEEHQHQIGHFLKSLLALLASSRAVLLITNQLVPVAGVMFGPTEATPWVTAQLRDHASQRVELRRGVAIKDREDTLGCEVNAKIVKNRLAAPMTRAEFEIHFATGLCAESDLLRLGQDAGLLLKRGSRLFLGEQALGAGRADALRLLREDAQFAARLRDGIVERLHG